MKIPVLFSDHMVLQRNKPIKIWGEGTGAVTVELDGTVARTYASDGKWSVVLPSRQAGGPYTLSIKDDTDSVVFSDVYVGEVWIASGQSNMEMITFTAQDGFETAKRLGNNDKIRLFTVPRRITPDFDGYNWHFESVKAEEKPWEICTEEEALHFSAIGFYFAALLEAEEDVAVGIISCNYGGSRIEAFIEADKIFSRTEFSHYYELCQETLSKLNFDEYNKSFEYYSSERTKRCPMVSAIDKVREMGIEEFGKSDVLGELPPPVEYGPKHFSWPGVIWENMIKSIIPYGVKGVLWYQGESNASMSEYYCGLFSLMVKSWRQAWDDKLPFITVQLTPHAFAVAPRIWPNLIQQQIKATRTIDDVYMVTTSELGTYGNVHSLPKFPIGERMFITAQSQVYGKGGEYCGPVFKKAEKDGNRLRLYFDHAESGLRSADSVAEMYVAGEDKVFKPAQVQFSGSELIVWNDEISDPCYAEMGYKNFCTIDLYNNDGFIAAPFATEKID